MRLRAFMRMVVPSLALWLTASCFGETGGTTSGGCSVGSAGCDCYGNGTCDGGLDCTTELKCVEPNCTEGTENCTCSDGMCFGTLQCLDGICQSVSGTETGNTEAGPETGNPMVCETLNGDECNLCIKDNCCSQFEQCVFDPACDCTLQCLEADNPPPFCVDECGPSELFSQLDLCIQADCPVCYGPVPSCDSGEFEPICRDCAKGNCCSQWLACLEDNSDCGCLEDCGSDGTPVMECLNGCGVIDPMGIPQTYLDLQSCTAQVPCIDGTQLCYH